MRRGLSAVEVLVAVAILGTALAALVSLSQSQVRDTYLLEYLAAAQWRARALMDSVLTRDLLALARELAPLPVRITDDFEERRLPDALLPRPSLLGGLDHVDPRQPAGPSRTPLFSDQVFLGQSFIAGRGRPPLFSVRVRVAFVFPGDVTRREHVLERRRLVFNPGYSHAYLPRPCDPLRQPSCEEPRQAIR